MSISARRHQAPRRAPLGADFWWVFAASTLTCLVSGTAGPLMARYALDQLATPPGLVGLVAGANSIAAIVLRPTLGRLADRYGLRRVGGLGCGLIAAGAVVLIAAHSVLPGTAGRLVSGLGGAAANTALMAWVIGLVPLEHRGRALGVFGVSVWLGLAAGPQIGEALLAAGGYATVWAGCGTMGLAAAACVALAGSPGAGRAAPPPPGDTRRILLLVARPGAASGIAWAAEGLVLTFLVLHLEAQGLPAGGLTGAASVFTAFAITVIGGRVILVGLVDRVGPVPTAAAALLTLAVGLATLAVAASFPVAIAGGVLLGAGFAPLFPALALLATAPLRSHERAAGVGIFSAFMDAGIATGVVLGGVLVATVGAGDALAILAAAQLGAIALVLSVRPHRSSSLAGLETSIASTEASEMPPP